MRWWKRKKFWIGVISVVVFLACVTLGIVTAFTALSFSGPRECQQYYSNPGIERVLLCSALLGLGLLIVVGLWLGSKRIAPWETFLRNFRLVGVFNVVGLLGLAGLSVISGYVTVSTIFEYYVQTNYPACSYGKQTLPFMLLHASWPLFLLAVNAVLLGMNNTKPKRQEIYPKP